MYLGLQWLATVAQLPCACSLSLVRGMPEVAVCTEVVDKEAKEWGGEDR